MVMKGQEDQFVWLRLKVGCYHWMLHVVSQSCSVCWNSVLCAGDRFYALVYVNLSLYIPAIPILLFNFISFC
jgi:hypothetical protein